MNRKPAVVGAFILGAVGVGILAVLFFGGMRWFAKSSDVVVLFSESVAGLDVGAPVTFNGARIGSVKSVTIHVAVGTLTARIPVVLELDSTQVTWEDGSLGNNIVDYGRLIRSGLRAQLALQSLITGQLRVDLKFLPDTPAQLVGTSKDLPEIPTVPSDLGQLRNELAGLKLRELSEAAQRALTALARVSDHVDASLGPVTSDLHETLAGATQTLRTTNEAIHRVQAEASTALENLDLLLLDARQQVAGRGAELSRTLSTINRVGQQGETLLGSLNGLAGPRAAFRGDLEAAMRDLAATASSLREFAQFVERNPNALLTGRAPR